MRHWLWTAAAVIVFACTRGGSQEADIAALLVRAESLRLSVDDSAAKMRTVAGSSEAAGLTSLRKNAVVTLGGFSEMRYYFFRADVRTSLAANTSASAGGPPAWNASASRVTRENHRQADLCIYSAKVTMGIEITENIDAYLRISLHDANSRRNVAGLAQNYWVRWKNLRGTGFGLLAGRDGIKFGDDETTGAMMNYTGGPEGLGEILWNSGLAAVPDTLAAGGQVLGDGMFAGGTLVPYHTGFDFGRTTQLNPYWENRDGTVRFDLSLLQARERMDGGAYARESGGTVRYRSVNYGLGSGTARLIWRPAEGLKLTASALNFRTSAHGSGAFGFRGSSPWGPGWADYGGSVRTAANNYAVNLAAQYRPAFCSRVKVWGQWIHGWNEAWVRDMDSDSANAGISADLTGGVTAFVQADILRVRNPRSAVWNNGAARSVYTGVRWTMPYRAELETGWKRESIRYRSSEGVRHTAIRGDTVYAHLGFSF